MNVREFCSRDVALTYRSTPFTEAARLMCGQHVGSLVVVEEGARSRVPVLTLSGTLAGIVATDDPPGSVAGQPDDLVRAIGSEQAREARLRK